MIMFQRVVRRWRLNQFPEEIRPVEQAEQIIDQQILPGLAPQGDAQQAEAGLEEVWSLLSSVLDTGNALREMGQLVAEQERPK